MKGGEETYLAIAEVGSTLSLLFFYYFPLLSRNPPEKNCHKFVGNEYMKKRKGNVN